MEAYWTEHKDYTNVVSSSKIEGEPCQGLSDVMKKCKRATRDLATWGKANFKCDDKEILKIKRRLVYLQQKK